MALYALGDLEPSVDPTADRMIRPGMLSYVRRGARYRKDLRRLE